MGEKFIENFVVKVGMRQGCVMSPRLFNVFVDRCKRSMKHKVVNTFAQFKVNGEVSYFLTCLFVNDTLFAESEGDLQIVVNECYNVCNKRNLMVTFGKSDVLVF